MLEFLESVTERKSELSLPLGQLDRSGFEQPGPGLSPANTCCVNYWPAKYPREFRQLRWAVGMGDKATPATSVLVQTVCAKFLELPGGLKRRAGAKPAHPTGPASSRLGVPSKGFLFPLFSNNFIDLYIFSFFPPLVLQIKGLLFFLFCL